MKYATCDFCTHTFIPKPREITHKSGAVQQFFHCPNCRRMYRIAKISKQGMQMRNALQKARLSGQGTFSDPALARKLESFQREVTTRDS